MKEIFLTQGYVALVDDDDYERVSQFNWQINRNKRVIYARGVVNGELVRMHNFIMGEGGEVDHKDLDGLNNTRQNLRRCSRSQNAQNRRKRRGSYTSKYKGVYQTKGKWRAQIGKQYIGTFKSEEEAAQAYNEKAKELYEGFAQLNVIP